MKWYVEGYVWHDCGGGGSGSGGNQWSVERLVKGSERWKETMGWWSTWKSLWKGSNSKATEKGGKEKSIVEMLYGVLSYCKRQSIITFLLPSSSFP